MSDLISRKDLQDHLLHDWAFNFKRTEYKDRKGYRKRDLEVQTVIINMPTMVPEELKKGNWVNNQNGTFTCDVCGCNHSRSNYCPDCGAYMRNTDADNN